ncbi:hypothetical protein V8E54_008612 [Elaphomyces granulatus]
MFLSSTRLQLTILLWTTAGQIVVKNGHRSRHAFSTRLNLWRSEAITPKLDSVTIERKWRERCQAESPAVAKSTWGPGTGLKLDMKDRPKFYVLSMFPYPSGTLHMGHLRVYTISDVLARFYRMRGFDVLHPMGWDAFGLPAENAAIDRGIDPTEWTRNNIARMKEQLRSIGTEFDWDKEFATCSTAFYKHTQRIFLMLYERGLAYQSVALVNYDPVDRTVLANEQVDANGFSWRSGAKVEQIQLKQWFFRITAYQDELLKDLDSLVNGWPERVLSMQKNWLGKSTGAKILFSVIAADQPDQMIDVEVFSTRPDTLYGVEYLALSLDHPVVLTAAKKDESLRKFLDEASSFPPDSKAGYRLSNLHATHPLQHIDKESPHLSRELPIFAAPYVLSSYGKGAVMGVPGHDSRDFAFYKLNMRPNFISMVITPEPALGSSGDEKGVVDADDAKPFTGEGFLTSRCRKYWGLSSQEAAKQIVSDLKRIGRGDYAETWRLRDWLISRQRHWGTPIPIIHCKSCGPVPVPTDQLPVTLPKVDAHWLKGKKGNPLECSEEWLHTKCPNCGGPAKRDTDTMDTFVDSSWYYLRFLDPANEDLPFSPAVARPVDVYIGGVEHAILHLLYARFIYKFLAETELFPKNVSTDLAEAPEPFRTLLSQGMVHGKTYSEPSTGRFLLPSEVDVTDPNNPLIKGTQITPNISFEKMSKSKHNGVDPTSCVLKYGADATRAHILFAAPVGEVLEWDEAKIVGIQRWFSRLRKVVLETRQRLFDASFALPADSLGSAHVPSVFPLDTELSDIDADAILSTHKTICYVTQCIEDNPYGLNSVISDLMKLTNALSSSLPKSPVILYSCVSALLRLLSPIAPALASELWEVLHQEILSNTELQNFSGNPSIFSVPWPTPLLTDSEVKTLSARGCQTTAVQVNGKLRFTVTIPRLLSNSEKPASASDTLPRNHAEHDAVTEAEHDWIISQILKTEKGQLWLTKRNDWRKRRRVVVVKGGKLVNVVF